MRSRIAWSGAISQFLCIVLSAEIIVDEDVRHQKCETKVVAELMQLVSKLEKEKEALVNERNSLKKMLQQSNASCFDAPSITKEIDHESLQEDITEMEERDHERIASRLGNKYSAVHCIGPASSLAVLSRQEHPFPSISEEDLEAGIEQDYYGGGMQRVCHIRNACLSSESAAVTIHLDPHNLDNSADFLKSEYDDGIGSRFVRLEGRRDGTQPADPFLIHDHAIPPDAHWHNGTYAYFEPFVTHTYFGHAIFDDLFSSFMAFRIFGYDPKDTDLNIIMSSPCQSESCRRFYHGWARGMSHSTIERPGLPPGRHCFRNLIIGVGQFATASGIFPGKDHGKTAMLREFHTLFYTRLGLAANLNLNPSRPAAARGGRLGVAPISHPTPPEHQVLINDKPDGRRRVLNFPEIQDAIQDTLGMPTDFTPAALYSLPAKDQIEILLDYTVILTPVGTVAYLLFFVRPGTSVVFISHVVWEDLFWNQVGFINDLYYIPDPSEVVDHDALPPAEQWHAHVIVRPAAILPVVLRAAQQQERWTEMYT